MRTFSKKKKLPRLLTLCGATSQREQRCSSDLRRSDTRNIDSYPGDRGHFLLSLRRLFRSCRNMALCSQRTTPPVMITI